MVESHSLNPSIPMAGKSVNLENFEDELSHLWKISADNMRTGQNTQVRTSILNLVICAPDLESAQNASRLLRDLSSTHLARVTIIIIDRTDTTSAYISTYVTIRFLSLFSDLVL